MVYLPPSHALELVTNRTNVTPIINIFLIFLIKSRIMLGTSTMRIPSVMGSTFCGYSGCNLLVGGVDNTKSLGHAKYSLAGF